MMEERETLQANKLISKPNIATNYKGGKFLKKLWCCVGGSLTR